jgi:hypothetical protein
MSSDLITNTCQGPVGAHYDLTGEMFTRKDFKRVATQVRREARDIGESIYHAVTVVGVGIEAETIGTV